VRTAQCRLIGRDVAEQVTCGLGERRHRVGWKRSRFTTIVRPCVKVNARRDLTPLVERSLKSDAPKQKRRSGEDAQCESRQAGWCIQN